MSERMKTDTNRRTVLRSGLAGWAVVSGLSCMAATRSGTGSTDGSVEVLERLDLVDPGRRTIPTRVYMPSGAGPFPVIIFSHGFGGDLGSFDTTSRIWADAGYIVIHPTHIDSVRNPDPSMPAEDRAIMRAMLARRSDDNGAPGGGRDALVGLLENPFYLDSRLRDIEFLSDRLLAGDGLHPGLHTRARAGPLGMAGHSYGAYTTEVLAGARLTTASRNPARVLQARFSAYMAISGQGAGRMGLDSRSFADIAGPLFSITGSRDFGAAGETPQWRLEPFFKSQPNAKFAALVEGFNHASFDPLAGAEPADTLRGFQIDFWSGWLRDESAARTRLVNAASQSHETDAVWLRARQEPS